MSQFFSSASAFQTWLNTLPPEKVGLYKFAQSVGFDVAWYAAAYMQPDANEPANTPLLTPMEHFFSVGASRLYQPNPLFDPDFYRSQYKDLAGLDSVDLLAHYLRFGIDEGRLGRSDLQNFDGARYLRDNPDVAAYVNANLPQFGGSVDNGARAHFVKFGSWESRAGFTTAGQQIGFNVTNPVSQAIAYGDVDGAGPSKDVGLILDTNFGSTTLTKYTANNGTIAADAVNKGVLRLVGDASVRIDFTNPNNQLRGIDLDGDGGISQNGVENNVGNAGIVKVTGMTVVDAYPRNPLNIGDTSNNFRGNIWFDGTGFAGNGTTTNGNIFLGGLGSDTAYGGIGNDFLAGGGGGDYLDGGRNADFFFREISAIDPTDNPSLNGGETEDADAVDGQGSSLEDFDWVLFEASDDWESQSISLGSGGYNNIEHLNASGNLYGFLDAFNIAIGQRAKEVADGRLPAPVPGTTNYGVGTTAQLRISGNADANIIIAGYDNDSVQGAAGNDLLMGGDLRFLITNKNNPNLLDANGGLNLNVNRVGVVTDGIDILNGGDGNDNIVFEMDAGTITGDADTGKTSGNVNNTDDKPYDGPRFATQGDMLWLTDFTPGRLKGATVDKEATAAADALAKMVPDGVVRVDLGTGNSFKNYGGAATSSQDTSNYASGTPALRTAVSGMESVNMTGLGAIDYDADGGNKSEVFNPQQNYAGLNANADLRGNGADNALLANAGTDTLEGRGGDDVLSGGAGSDRFVVAFGDGIDWLARPVDANGDGLWDTTGGLTVAGGLAWGQDFRAPAAATAGTTTLIVDFGTTVIDGVDTFVATFQVNIDGVQFGTAIPASTLAAAKNTTEVASIVNADYNAKDKNVTVVATSATTIEVRVVDATPGDGKLPVIGTTPAEGFFVAGTAPGAGNTFSANGSILGTQGTNLEDDRLIIKTYEDRSINLGVDQTKAQIAQAAQMVLAVGTAGTRVVEAANGYTYRLYLDSIREGDKVTVDINGTKYEYTLKAGENAEAAATGLTTAINTALDINAASGTIAAVASLNSFGDAFDTGNQQAGVAITQSFISNSATYMDISASVSRADGATPFGSVFLHNQANTMVQMLGFNGLNGGLTSQDKAGTPVILFQGRNVGTTTMSKLVTAKDSGETIVGTDANYVSDKTAAAFNSWVNGDDLIYGGKGDDKLIGGTGDDRFVMTGGADTVYGDNEDGTGGFGLLADGVSKQFYTDVLQGEERSFGAGSRFKVTLDGTLYKNGVGTLTALDSADKALATTSFNGIELVRVLENSRASSFDLKALSDSVAAAVGDNSLPTEGLYVALTKNPSTQYWIDKNGDGVISASEKTTATAVLGTENLTTGNANDFVTLDQTQATANNVLDLGAQQDNTVLATLREGADIVSYDHADVNNDGAINATDVPLRPTLTLQVQGASSSTMGMTAGALGTATTTDTLGNVEIVNVVLAATSDRYNDVVDLSKLAGGTVNYGAAEAVGKSLGGGNAPVTTVAELDANTLDNGGIATTGSKLGSELVTVQGITLMERVTGSDGADRVIVANTMPVVASGAFASKAGPRTTVFDYNNTIATGVNATPANRPDQGLFQWNLAGGSNDMVDYKQETGPFLIVSVDTSGDNDLIWVDNRIDSATGVERYFGGSIQNWIDLGAATVATTIEFSKEASTNAPANEFADPAGNDGTTTSGLTRGIEVRNTADNSVFARFMDRTGAGTVTAPAFWQNVFGSNNGETVLFTDNETAIAHSLLLRGGANTVDYSALTTTITATIGPVNTGVASLEQQSVANGDNVWVNRATDPAANHLTLVGSTRAGDQLDVTALVANRTVPIAGNLVANTSLVDPLFNVVNLATGVVTESLYGQYPGPSATVLPAAFPTFVVGFENASNGGDADVVHMLGDNGRNALSGGTNNDLLYGGRGTAGDGTADVGLGNRGDALSGAGGANVFLYRAETESPGGSIAGGEQLGSNFGNNNNNVINSRDTLVDIVSGTDRIAIELNDSYEVVRAAGSVPANLANPLNSVTPIVGVFNATDTQIDLARDATAAQQANRVDNYWFDHPAAGGLTGSDFVFRVFGSSGNDVLDASLGVTVGPLNVPAADTANVQFVYTAANQSQAGGFDQIVRFNSGDDSIDLSFLKLPRYESTFAGNGVDFDTNDNNIVDAIDPALGANPIRSLGAAPIFAINASAANLFIDGAIYRPIATQSLVDGNGDTSTTVFIDANGDGNYDPTADMAVVLVGVVAPVAGDFVFTQYGGGWGG